MQFGAHLPTYWDDYGTSDVRTAVQEAAKAAEALGYDSVWANDLVIVPATLDQWCHQVIDPLVTLATIVHLAPRVKLGTSVLVLPWRNPILVAKQVAALDLLSGGRFILGAGIGHLEDAFNLLGVNYAHRAVMTDEAIEVLQILWREPVAQFHGEFYHLDDAVMLPKPTRSSGPPIWIGGNSNAALQRAARYGKAWIPYIFDFDGFQSGVATLRGITEGQTCPMIGGYFNLRIEKPGKPAAVKTQSRWASISIQGSADTIAQDMEQFRQAGLEYAICLFESEDVDDYLRQIHIFAEQIAPQFADAE